MWPKATQKVRWKGGRCSRHWLLFLFSVALLGNCLPRVTAQGMLQNSKYPNRPPRFLIDGHSEIVLRLKEGPETPVGSLIYKLRGADPDNDPLVFGIRDTGYGSDVLRIENLGNNEANLYLAQELDREAKDEYSIILTLTDNRLGDGNFVTQSLLLLVEDVNDNQPVFKPFQSALEIAEHSRPGIVTTVEATDLDEGAFGQVVYHLQELEGDDDVFSITTVNGRGVIRLVRDLDFERKNLYQLRVLAKDRSSHQGKVNTGTAALLIKVRDIEDQPPEFVSVTPVIRIPEDTPKFSKISQVRAIDGDRGVNNPIRYTLVNGFGLFAVNATSGVISTTRELDRENTENQINGAYIITIRAEEVSAKSGGVSGPSVIQTEVTIILNDINDERPTFRSPAYDCEINENAQINTPVTFLGGAVNEVFDHDQGLNGTFELFLYPDNDIFEVIPARAINDATFSVRVKNPFFLDFEQVKELNYTLVAKELTPGGGFSRVPIRIQVRDQNDNFPEFVQAVYEVSVPENVQMGAVIATVRAVDNDSGHFGTQGIRYTNMGGSIAHLLNLNAATGAISVNSPGGAAFDRELVTSHYLTVEARDDLGKGNRNTVQLIVNLEDVNDNAPQFLQSRYEAILMENKITFETPLVVEAKDIDLNGTRNSQLRYELGDGEFKGNFTVHPQTGVIRPKFAMDFEAIPRGHLPQNTKRIRPPGHMQQDNVKAIYLSVIAMDHGVPSLSAQVPVTIYVQDVNDHPPQFQRSFYERTIPEDLPAGSPVLEVRAHDGDGSAPNNRVVYRIQGGASDKFVIGADTGIISIAPMATLDPDLTEQRTTRYSLTVVAWDSGVGEQQLSDSTLVNITIADVNNKPPVFQDPGTVVIKENTPVGTAVFRVIAHDPDSKPVLRYRLDNQTSEARSEDGVLIKASDYDYLGAFALNEDTGMLTVVKLLDRERVEHIRLGFTVEDVAALKGRQVVSGALNVVVEDENDNSPRFKAPFYKRAVTENAANGVTVAHVVAVDADKNRTITYALEGSVEVLRFLHLDRESGEIVVASRIDREVHEWLNVTVRATDDGVPPRSSRAEVFVQVLDENDNNPVFVGDVQNVTVREGAAIGTPIARIEARDIDAGEFGKITYLMDRISSQGKFAIDPNSGVLSVADRLDREAKDAYMLVIEAWDNYQFGYLSGESRNAFKQIHVTVLDENDSPPVLHLPSGCVQITEYHDLNEIVAKVTATDADDPQQAGNGMVEFRIVGGDDRHLFKILQRDANTAVVYATDFLQGRYGNYSLQVAVSDKGVPPNVVTGVLNICVADYNDHAPVFISPVTNTTIRVPENATVGTELLRIVARDDDVGPNAAIRYRLKADPLGNSRWFAIEPETGILRLKMPLDREQQKLHEIRIEAYDQGVPTPLSSDLDLIIYVRNVNDYEPQFVVEEIAVDFTEHQWPGVEKKRLPDTVDRDEVDDLHDPPTVVCYYIVHGNEAGRFHLDAVSHVLAVAQELDREEQSNYTLLVKATEDCEGSLPQSPIKTTTTTATTTTEEAPSLPGWHAMDAETEQAVVMVDQDNGQSESRIHETRRMPAKHKTISSRYVDPQQQQQGRQGRYLHMRHLRSVDGMTVDAMATAIVQRKVGGFRRQIDSYFHDGLSVEEVLRRDSTLIKVTVQVNDINDNPPVFESKVFTGGVTTEADFGTAFMQIKATDKDEGRNGKVSYYMLGEVHKTLTEGLENVNAEPFLVDVDTGMVHLNFDPLKGMKGYFDFRVVANDTDGYQDTAHVFIYLLREDQRVRFVLRQQPAEIREKLLWFRDALGNVTNAIVNVDEMKVHENKDGSVDKTKTDLYIHLVDRVDNSIMDVADVLKLVDGNIEQLDDLFKEFNVLDTQPAEALLLTAQFKKGQVLIWLIFSNVFVAALLIIMASLCLSQRSSYRRQLRAARVNTFGNPTAADLVNRGATRVPNTNKHSVEGSNPIWLKGYENEWYKNDETYSQGSGQDSLDENIIVNEQFVNAKMVHKDGVALGVSVGGLSSAMTTTARNLNLYQQIDKLSNTANMLAKKLETTEL